MSAYPPDLDAAIVLASKSANITLKIELDWHNTEEWQNVAEGSAQAASVLDGSCKVLPPRRNWINILQLQE